MEHWDSSAPGDQSQQLMGTVAVLVLDVATQRIACYASWLQLDCHCAGIEVVMI